MTSNPKAPLDSVVLQVLSAGWVKCDELVPDGAQMLDGEWYAPKWGCDSLEASLDALLYQCTTCRRDIPRMTHCPHCHHAASESASSAGSVFLATIRNMVDGGWRFEWDLRTGFIGACHPLGGKQTICEIHGNSYIDKDRLGLGITKMLNAMGTQNDKDQR
jgi:hypothetical protein